MKLGLGTVQFGRDYGISNTGGKVTEGEAEAILSASLQAGVDLLDTAPHYGNSEDVIGKLLPSGSAVNVVTKTPQFRCQRISRADAETLVRTYHESLSKLGVAKAYGLLVHYAGDLLARGGDALFDAMLGLKSQGLVQKIGVSVYSGEEIDQLLERFEMDLIQLPLNVLDQRLAASGHLAKVNGAGIEIHARSLFLQGLLVMQLEQVPPYFDRLKPQLARYLGWLQEHRLSPVQAALAFVRQLGIVDYAIVGVTSAAELLAVLDALRIATPNHLDFTPFACDDETLLNPVHWQTRAA